MGTKKKKKRKRQPASARGLAALAEKIAVQRRRALRPMVPVNTQARVSESLAEKRRKDERKRRQRKEWEEL